MRKWHLRHNIKDKKKQVICRNREGKKARSSHRRGAEKGKSLYCREMKDQHSSKGGRVGHECVGYVMGSDKQNKTNWLIR